MSSPLEMDKSISGSKQPVPCASSVWQTEYPSWMTLLRKGDGLSWLALFFLLNAFGLTGLALSISWYQGHY